MKMSIDKIGLRHRERAAYVYIRQSSLHQVRHHQESSRRRYERKQRAQELGFAQVVVIDDDLGLSGNGRKNRPGFGRLLTAVCEGLAGAVLALEASRLARNTGEYLGADFVVVMKGKNVISPAFSAQPFCLTCSQPIPNRAFNCSRVKHDRFAAHLYRARREYRSACDSFGKRQGDRAVRYLDVSAFRGGTLGEDSLLEGVPTPRE